MTTTINATDVTPKQLKNQFHLELMDSDNDLYTVLAILKKSTPSPKL